MGLGLRFQCRFRISGNWYGTNVTNRLGRLRLVLKLPSQHHLTMSHDFGRWLPGKQFASIMDITKVRNVLLSHSLVCGLLVLTHVLTITSTIPAAVCCALHDGAG
jgi:hypothetical protein